MGTHALGEELTPLQQIERDAMCGDRSAVLQVVSGLRGYRALVQKLIDRRYGDGFTELGSTSDDVEEIEGAPLPIGVDQNKSR